jgi:hypothetical protein
VSDKVLSVLVDIENLLKDKTTEQQKEILDTIQDNIKKIKEERLKK